MKTFRVHSCDVTLHDAHDATLYKRFFDAHIATRHCTSCDVHAHDIVARVHFDDDDNACAFDVASYHDDVVVVLIDDVMCFA